MQMETTQPEKVENTDPVQPGEGADAANTQAVTVAPEEQQAEPVIEYPAYFEPAATKAYRMTFITQQTVLAHLQMNPMQLHGSQR